MPLKLLLPTKFVKQQQFCTFRRTAEISATIKDLNIEVVISTKSLLAIWLTKKMNGSWRMMVKCCKLNQVVIQMKIAVPDVASLVEQINISPGT